MEEPEMTERSEQNRKAVFSGFSIMRKMTSAIQPDRSYRQLRLEEFK